MSELPPTIDGTDFDLLTAVKARLTEKVPKLTDGLCLICDEPLPPESYYPRGDFAMTLALTDGTFDKSMYDAGGANQLCESKRLIATVLRRSNIDQPGRLEHAMLDEDRGILTRYKPFVLRAILVDDPAADILAPWQPMKNGKPILRGAIMPDISQGPRQVTGGGWLGLSLFFIVEFDWELRAPVTE